MDSGRSSRVEIVKTKPAMLESIIFLVLKVKNDRIGDNKPY